MATMTAGVSVQTDAQLLYLAIDLGDRPGYHRFYTQVQQLTHLQWYCTNLVPPVPDERPRPSTTEEDMIKEIRDLSREVYSLDEIHLMRFKIVRTSVASPWVTILTDAVKNSAPIAYGMGALVTLQRLMQMVMQWQLHRQELSERRHGKDAALEILSRLRNEVKSHGEVPEGAVEDAANAITRIDSVISSELIEPDDSRLLDDRI
jgi:hypothetical protein